MTTKRVLILGAAGRDFHNFNVHFRDNRDFRVVAFTAAQIPHIEGRTYPAELAGEIYPEGIPIFPESELERLVSDQGVDEVVLAYSDLSHAQVMHLASRALASGADFHLLGPQSTMLRSQRHVIAICAVRTGSGKSQTCRYVADVLREAGKKVVVVRHPMPYGDLVTERVQRFATMADLDAQGENITIEEREEYEPHIAHGTVVFAGVDYGEILKRAETEGDLLLWDGGNNDIPFYWPDLWICVADPHRAGHEMGFHPGEVNFRSSDLILINKANTAPAGSVDAILENAQRLNPQARVVVADSEVRADAPDLIRGKRVLLIEDGPTLTHGGMSFGAGGVAAEKYGATEVVDPRAFAVGSIRELYTTFPRLGRVVPAMGYYPEQIAELEETIRRSDCDTVVIATPVDLRRLVEIDKPVTRVSYDLVDRGSPTLAEEVRSFLQSLTRPRAVMGGYQGVSRRRQPPGRPG